MCKLTTDEISTHLSSLYDTVPGYLAECVQVLTTSQRSLWGAYQVKETFEVQDPPQLYVYPAYVVSGDIYLFIYLRQK